MAQRGSLATQTSAHLQEMHLEEVQRSRTGHSMPAGLLDKARPILIRENWTQDSGGKFGSRHLKVSNSSVSGPFGAHK